MLGVLLIGVTLPAVPAAAGPTTATRLTIGDFENRAAGGPRTVALRRVSTPSFSAVGVTWTADSATGPVSVAVRGRQPHGWTPWLSADAAEPSRDGRTGLRDGAELVWLGPSQGVEVAVTAASGTPPRDIAADLIDPKVRPEDANEAAPRPSIARRAAWGADEKKMTWKPEYTSLVKAVTLHHTATTNRYTRAEVPGILRSIYHYQAVSRGWGDIGYHVLVDRFGRLWEGRFGGLDRPVIGAHAGGFNRETAGIGVIGNHSSVAVPAAVVESAAQYVAWKLSLSTKGVDPRGATQLTGGGSTSRYKPGTTITVPRVFPHRQTNYTECPGQRGVDVLGAVRKRAYEIGTNGDQPVPIR